MTLDFNNELTLREDGTDAFGYKSAVIVDRRIALLSISRAGGDSFLILALRHAGFVEHVLASFESHWERARPLPR